MRLRGDEELIYWNIAECFVGGNCPNGKINLPELSQPAQNYFHMWKAAQYENDIGHFEC